MRQQAGIPARMTVVDSAGAAAQLSGAQFSAVNGLVAAFRHKVATSIIPNNFETARIPGNGLVQMRSSFGVMTVDVRVPVATKAEEKVTKIAEYLGGIQIDTAAGRFILRPPSIGSIDPSRWSLRKITNEEGGTAYVAVGGMSFVASEWGLYRSGKRMGDTIHGNGGRHQLGASASFPISGLFISNGAVKQLRVDGDELLLGGRVIRELPGGGVMPVVSYALPPMSDGDSWDMVSARQDGQRFAVCRIGRDGDWPSVREVAHFLPDSKVPGGLVLESVLQMDYVVGQRLPSDPGGRQAPVWGTFNATKGDADYAYDDSMNFELDAVYRAYIGHTGNFVVDRIKVISRSNISVSDLGTETGDYWRNQTDPIFYEEDGRIIASVRVVKSEEITFSWQKKVKVRETKVENDRSYYGHIMIQTYLAYLYQGIVPVYDAAGSRYDSDTSSSMVSHQENRILFADEQFSVIAVLSLSISYSASKNHTAGPVSFATADDPNYMVYVDFITGNGANGHYIPVTNSVSSSLDAISVSLDISVGLDTVLSIDLGGASDEEHEAMESRLRSLVARLESPDKITYKEIVEESPTASSGFSQNAVTYVPENIISEFIQQRDMSVKYAKDPRTGCGFFSFLWNGVYRNFAVGPWGVVPSAELTDVASGELVAWIVSV